MDPELWFVKRCIKFISMCLKSDNNTVKTISMMGLNGLYSVSGSNYGVLCTKYGINLKLNIMQLVPPGGNNCYLMANDVQQN